MVSNEILAYLSKNYVISVLVYIAAARVKSNIGSISFHTEVYWEKTVNNKTETTFLNSLATLCC